jgi:hypothetical protein
LVYSKKEGSRQAAVLDSGHDTRNIERYADTLVRDPRYAKHSDAEILKATYWRGVCESTRAAQGNPLDLAAFDEKMADRGKLAKLPDVPELQEQEISRPKRERDEPEQEL